MEQLQYQFKNQAIGFENNNERLMVNATQMAKLFDKQVKAFLRNENAKLFIAESLKSENSHYLGIKTEEDLITSKQKSGTWMHQVLALKFAAWLSPAFELWVYSTINEILIGKYKILENSLKQSATRRGRIETLKGNLGNNKDYAKLKVLELEERQAGCNRKKFNSDQLDMFSQTI